MLTLLAALLKKTENTSDSVNEFEAFKLPLKNMPLREENLSSSDEKQRKAGLAGCPESGVTLTQRSQTVLVGKLKRKFQSMVCY